MSSKLSPADEAFQSLAYGGAVTGLCISTGPQVIRSRMPFSTRRIEAVARLVDEAFLQQASKGRAIDQIWFGLGAFNLLAVTHGGVRIIFLHVRDEETDFLAQIGRLFLEDFGDEFIKSPEHKRLVTARVLVHAPVEEEPDPRLPASPATSRIPQSPRLRRLQESHKEEGKGRSDPQVVPKPVKRKTDSPESSDSDSPDGTPPAPTRSKVTLNPPKESGRWPEFRERIYKILERAVGDEKARAIIKEQTEEFTGDHSNALPKAWFKEFGNTVVAKIEKNSLQDRARNELVATFRDLSL